MRVSTFVCGVSVLAAVAFLNLTTSADQCEERVPSEDSCTSCVEEVMNHPGLYRACDTPSTVDCAICGPSNRDGMECEVVDGSCRGWLKWFDDVDCEDPYDAPGFNSVLCNRIYYFAIQNDQGDLPICPEE